MKEQTKKLCILGSTGSIGRQTLDVVRQSAGDYEVTGLAAGSGGKALEVQIRAFKPRRGCGP